MKKKDSNEPDVVVGERVIEVSDSLTWHQNKDEKLFRKKFISYELPIKGYIISKNYDCTP